jgi:oligopeptide/dipeptide ABC transporter ATP-binding protein
MHEPLLELRGVSKTYRTLGRGWRAEKHRVQAVRDVSLHVRPGEVYGLVGESGSGKSTLMRLVLALERPDAGRVIVSGTDLSELHPQALRLKRRDVQIVFQDPYSALNPLMTVARAISEPLENFDIGTQAERQDQVVNLLRDVGLPLRLLHAHPHQLSGGERQRVCIARALALRPKLLVCDEPVSALDKSIQAQILNVLRDLQQRHGLTYLFISHDLAVVNYLCTRVAVMLRGQVVEEGERLQVLHYSTHPYTRSLLAAAAFFADGRAFPDLPAAATVSPVTGCMFQDRCPRAQPRCRNETPMLREVTPKHRVACHFPEDYCDRA